MKVSTVLIAVATARASEEVAKDPVQVIRDQLYRAKENAMNGIHAIKNETMNAVKITVDSVFNKERARQSREQNAANMKGGAEEPSNEETVDESTAKVEEDPNAPVVSDPLYHTRVETREVTLPTTVMDSTVVHGTEQVVVDDSTLMIRPVTEVVERVGTDVITKTNLVDDYITKKIDDTKIVVKDVSHVVHEQVSKAVPITRVVTVPVQRIETEQVVKDKVYTDIVEKTQRLIVPVTEIKDVDVSHVEQIAVPANLKGTEKVVIKEERNVEYDTIERKDADGNVEERKLAEVGVDASGEEVPVEPISTDPDTIPMVDDEKREDKIPDPIITNPDTIPIIDNKKDEKRDDRLPDPIITNPDTIPIMDHEKRDDRLPDPIITNPDTIPIMDHERRDDRLPDPIITNPDTIPIMDDHNLYYHHSAMPHYHHRVHHHYDNVIPKELIPVPVVVNAGAVLPITLPDRSALVRDFETVEFIDKLLLHPAEIIGKVILIDIGNREYVVVEPTVSSLNLGPKFIIHDILQFLPRNRINCFCHKVIAATYKWLHKFPPGAPEEIYAYDLLNYIDEIQSTFRRIKNVIAAQGDPIDGELMNPETNLKIKVVDPSLLSRSNVTLGERQAILDFYGQ